MQPLFAVHNNVSLLSITIAPSTFLAALTLALVFLSLYLPRLPSLPRFFPFGSSDKNGALTPKGRKQRGVDYEYGVFSDHDRDRLAAVHWRNRQLPPLPPPPFRPLLRERGEADYNDYAGGDDDGDSNPEGGWPAAVFRRSNNLKVRERGTPDKAKSQKEREKDRPLKLRVAKPGKRSSDRPASTPSPSARQKHRSRSSHRPEHREHVNGIGPVYDCGPFVGTSSDSSSDLRAARRWRTNRDEDQFGDSGDDAAEKTIDGEGPCNRLLTPAITPNRARSPQHQPPLPAHGQQPPRPPTFGQLSNHSAYLETDTEGSESMRDSASAAGYSPPAWRRLENGDRSSGFWRKTDNILGSPTLMPGQLGSELELQRGLQQHQQPYQHSYRPPYHQNPLQIHRRRQSGAGHPFPSRGSSPGFDSEDDDVVTDLLGLDDDDMFDLDRPAMDGDNGGGFYKGGGFHNGAADDVLERASRIRLPDSMSPEAERIPAPQLVFPSADSRASNPTELQPPLEPPESYIQFAVRTEVQHRTALVEAVRGFVRGKLRFVTRSWAHGIVSVLVVVLAFAAMRAVCQPASLRPVPDLVKVAGIARAFEPLIYYSEHGLAQVHDLEATGVAVWDLGESVRLSNLTSAPIIVKELDDLSETLSALAMELTKFFANIDGDIDGILIVMDWARRELNQLQQVPSATSPTHLLLRPLTFTYDSFHNLLTVAGLLENTATGSPTAAGAVATTLFGMSGPQRTRETLRRTFHEFLAVLEEAVATELQYSTVLFALFEAVDRQFANLVRTVARESSVQEGQHADLLAGLWTRILGPSAAATAKYERNRELLRDVREKTVRNKGVLLEHNRRLLALKTSLESVRRKLVSPLVRSVNSSTLTLDEQIRGLEDVGAYLDAVRARQKGKLLYELYGAGAQHERPIWGDDSGGAGGSYYYEAGAGEAGEADDGSDGARPPGRMMTLDVSRP